MVGANLSTSAETLAIDRAKRLFDCAFANVQPHSGAQANQAVFLALLQPGDTVLGMGLAAGGHLTHGARPNLSGKWFNAISYGVRREDGRIDFRRGRAPGQRRTAPRLIIAGGSAYSRIIDFGRFRAIADRVGAYLMVDMAHFAGLVAGDAYPDPRLPHAHVGHDDHTQNSARAEGWSNPGNDEEIAMENQLGGLSRAAGRSADACDRRQGGRAARGFAACVQAIRECGCGKRESTRCPTLEQAGLEIVSGGTDSHLMLVDLRSMGITGRDAEKSLERAGVTCNKNAIPFDPKSLR